MFRRIREFVSRIFTPTPTEPEPTPEDLFPTPEPPVDRSIIHEDDGISPDDLPIHNIELEDVHLYLSDEWNSIVQNMDFPSDLAYNIQESEHLPDVPEWAQVDAIIDSEGPSHFLITDVEGNQYQLPEHQDIFWDSWEALKELGDELDFDPGDVYYTGE